MHPTYVKKIRLIFSLFLFPAALAATDLQIHQTILYHEHGEMYAVVNLSWENAWHNGRNHDAVWLFFKFGTEAEGYRHLYLAPDGHEAVSEGTPSLAFEVPADSTGVFIYPARTYRGGIQATVRIHFDPARLPFDHPYGGRTTKAYGLEMVYIPAGGFTLGDPDTSLLEMGAVYRSDGRGNFDGLVEVTREDQVIEVGPEAGKLYYRTDPYRYKGDQEGPVPATFPKGVRAFYIMKYEVTQGQYADFLNSLLPGQTQHRVIYGHKEYYRHRGTIRREGNNYVAVVPERPLNYASWDDGMAFADWAGLRPMTELEFTKACRGPSSPQLLEYPWGTESKSKLLRLVTPEGDLSLLGGLEEGMLSDENRHLFGASFYWVMDMAGSIWERTVTFGDAAGRAFTGNHGDGHIGYYGFADVAGWPAGGTVTEGFGFRGGGFYTYGRTYGAGNPFRKIADRSFGGWPGGVRTEAYGQRFVRTAP